MLQDRTRLIIESRQMIKLAIPAVVAQLAQMSMGTIDTIMSGQLSTEALASISVANNIFIPLLILVLGTLMALNPLVSHAMGARQTVRVAEYLRQGLYIAVALAIPCFLLIPLAQPLMIMIGVEESIQPIVLDYLLALRWGLISFSLFLALRFVNEGLFSTDVIMYISLAAIPFNIVLNYIFMYGYFGLPAMGAVGLGYATSLVWTLMFISIGIFTLSSSRYREIPFLSGLHWPNLTIIREILKLAVPLSMTLFLEVFLFAFVGLLIGRYALEIIAAHQIALNVASIIYMIPLGLSIAITARVGHAHGRHSPEDCKLSAALGISYGVIVSIVTTIILLTFPVLIVSIYSDQQTVIDETLSLLAIAAIFLIVDSIQVTAAAALRGLHDTFIPMLIAGISYWLVGFPVGYYLAEFQGMLAQGYWYGFVSGLSCAAVMMIWRLRQLLFRIEQIQTAQIETVS